MNQMGTTECLRALLKANPAAEAKIIAFTRVGRGSMSRWIRGEGPIGFNLLRLRVFLLENGFSPVEWQGKPQDVIDFARLVAHRLVSESEARKDLSCASDDVLLRLILCRETTNAKRLEVMRTYLDLYKGKLPELAGVKQPETAPQVRPKPAAEGQSPSGCKQAMMKALAGAIATIRPLAEFLASDECTAADRDELRRLAGDSLFKASTAMNKLNSEFARRMVDRHH